MKHVAEDGTERIRYTYRAVPRDEQDKAYRFPAPGYPTWRGDDFTEAEARALAEKFYPGWEFQSKTDTVVTKRVTALRRDVKKRTDWRKA